MAAALHLKLLGGFGACRPDGAPLAIAGKKNQALLAYLALCRGQPQTREKIVGLLWSDRDDEHARNSLRQALVALRRDLDSGSSALVVAGDRLALDPDLVDVDALAVEHLASSPRTDDLRTAVQLYRGDLLDGLAIADQAFEDWLAGERTRFRELVIAAILRGLPDLAGDEAVALAQRVLALDPLREASHRALMRAFAGNGQADLALRQYQVCRDVLRRELGVEPDAETASLRDEIAGATRNPPPTASAPQAITRRLAAILAADVAGYSRLMGADEEGTLKSLNLFRGIITQLIEAHQGRIVGTAGDNVLAEFASAVLAVRCAVAVQRALDRHNADLDETRRMKFRIGINVGDVIVQGADLLGDGVNVAARLEQMAEPGGIVVSGTVWEQIQGKVDFPCSYLGEQTAKNIARPLRTYRVDWEQPDMRVVGSGGTPEAPALPNKPSIAVLPFANMSGDPAQQYFSDGITEDIITELSRFRSLFVIARNSAFQYRDKAVDVRRVAHDLGVQYVVEGSVRIAGERLRISAQLIEAGTGNHLWAERYDRNVGDVLAVQAETAQAIAAVAGARTDHAERARAMRLDPSNLRAYHHHLRGRHLINRYRRETYQQAQIELETAIRLDPGLAEAYADLSKVHLNNRMLYWVADRAGALTTAFTLAQKAVGLDERSSGCRRALALAHVFRREYDEAALHFETGIELNPNDSSLRGIYAFYLSTIGRFDEALRQFDIVAGQDPRDEVWFPWARGAALFTGRHYEAAIRSLRQVVDPFTEVHGWLAASLAMAGRTAEAKVALDDFLRLAESDMAVFPGRRLSDWEEYWHGAIEYRDQKDFDHLFAALKKAGWPE